MFPVSRRVTFRDGKHNQSKVVPQMNSTVEAASTPKHYTQVVKVFSRIPKGFRNKAQGCEACLPRRTRRRQARATLGKSGKRNVNPNGVAPVNRRQAATPSGLRDLQYLLPRVGASRQPWTGGRNPFGIRGFSRLEICVMFRFTPRSARATMGVDVVLGRDRSIRSRVRAGKNDGICSAAQFY